MNMLGYIIMKTLSLLLGRYKPTVYYPYASRFLSANFDSWLALKEKCLTFIQTSEAYTSNLL